MSGVDVSEQSDSGGGGGGACGFLFFFLAMGGAGGSQEGALEAEDHHDSAHVQHHLGREAHQAEALARRRNDELVARLRRAACGRGGSGLPGLGGGGQGDGRRLAAEQHHGEVGCVGRVPRAVCGGACWVAAGLCLCGGWRVELAMFAGAGRTGWRGGGE